MTVRDITDFTPGELRFLLRQPLDAVTRKAVRAEIRRRSQLAPPRPRGPRPPARPAAPAIPAEPLLTTSEVAAIFGVGAKSVTRWANAGKLTCKRTPGGHRRYSAAEVYALRDAP
jgi:excisionase family DNA binding protein